MVSEEQAAVNNKFITGYLESSGYSMSVAIEEGADVNSRLSSGDTVLSLAARDGEATTVKELLAFGAEVNKSMIDGAKNAGHNEIANLLSEVLLDPSTRQKPEEIGYDMTERNAALAKFAEAAGASTRKPEAVAATASQAKTPKALG